LVNGVVSCAIISYAVLIKNLKRLKYYFKETKDTVKKLPYVISINTN
jgi:hypothetical protein